MVGRRPHQIPIRTHQVFTDHEGIACPVRDHQQGDSQIGVVPGPEDAVAVPGTVGIPRWPRVVVRRVASGRNVRRIPVASTDTLVVRGPTEDVGVAWISEVASIVTGRLGGWIAGTKEDRNLSPDDSGG